MGMEALLLAGAGAGLSAYNTSQTMGAQNSALNTEIADQQLQQQRANSVLGNMIQKVRASTPQQAQQQLSSAYLTAIKNGQQQANLALAMPMGGVSSAYRTTAANDAAGVDNYGNTQGTLLADMGAPSLQRQQEGFDVSRAGSAVSGIAQSAMNQDAIDRMRVMSVRRNPWMDFLGQTLGSYGMGQAMQGSGAAAGAAPASGSGGYQFWPSSGGGISGYPWMAGTGNPYNI